MRFYDVLTVIVMIKPTPHIAIKLYNDIINSHKDAAEAIPTKATCIINTLFLVGTTWSSTHNKLLDNIF